VVYFPVKHSCLYNNIKVSSISCVYLQLDVILLFLRNGFNILLYGLGSKKVLLDQFRSSKLSRYLQVVVNGFFPSLTIKNVSVLSNNYLQCTGVCQYVLV